MISRPDDSSPEAAKADDGRDGAPPDEDAGTFDRSFKYAVIVYAVVEFIVIALALWYGAAR
ncbi:MAG TPA: hypothetical protein VF611_06065 [Pyrinomonadaceae bacterium]|jgi:hypothetical protein